MKFNFLCGKPLRETFAGNQGFPAEGRGRRGNLGFPTGRAGKHWFPAIICINKPKTNWLAGLMDILTQLNKHYD
jgi:hypothetical protein